MGRLPPLLLEELLLDDELLEELDEELDELELDDELLEEDGVTVTTATLLVTEPPPLVTTTV
jgi:hypothetical protein